LITNPISNIIINNIPPQISGLTYNQARAIVPQPTTIVSINAINHVPIETIEDKNGINLAKVSIRPKSILNQININNKPNHLISHAINILSS
jgi:hypothetical protein